MNNLLLLLSTYHHLSTIHLETVETSLFLHHSSSPLSIDSADQPLRLIPIPSRSLNFDATVNMQMRTVCVQIERRMKSYCRLRTEKSRFSCCTSRTKVSSRIPSMKMKYTGAKMSSYSYIEMCQ
jgi:hypothetical protein